MIIRLSKDTPITPELIKKVIEKFKLSELPRLIKLEQYYLNKNEILNRIIDDPTKPNNKIANPFAQYITDTLVGYFIGEPISYTCENKDLLLELNALFKYNDEADENMELAKAASIYGVAYELLYVDEDAKVRFTTLDTKTCIPLYDDTVGEELLGFVRFYQNIDLITNNTYTIIEVYTADEVVIMKANEAMSSIEVVDSQPNYFKMVPIAIYRNNNELMGDFERVIPLIDAYDKMESDSLNDFEYFVDSYLALYGFSADPEDIMKMKQNRVLLMDEGTSAQWLTKEENDNHIENNKSRLDADIHKFAKCPNLADKEFASNASGVAIKFKLLGTENLTSIKERKFKRGLQQRLELVSQIDSLLDRKFDWREIDIMFTRNIPSNDVDLANMVSKLDGIVSKETLLGQIPFVEDVQVEIARLNQEDADNEKYRSSLDYLTGAMRDRIGGNSNERKNS